MKSIQLILRFMPGIEGILKTLGIEPSVLVDDVRVLSADFTELLTSHISVEMPVGVLRGRFRALPHHSTSRIVSSPNI